MATAAGRAAPLSAEQIAKYAYDAGFRGQALVNAVAIALAESGGRPDASNPNGEDSRGLWQINVAPNVRPNRWGNLYDPAVNARAAFEVSGGGKNFNPWTTFTGATEAGRRSSHSTHLAAAQQAAATVEGNPAAIPTSSPSSTTDPGALPDDATPEQIEKFIREEFPEIAPFLANDEIRGVLLRPDLDDLGDPEIESLIRNTNYWRTHGPDSRAFDRLIAEEESAAGALVDTAKRVISDQWLRAGVGFNDQQLGEAAKNAIRAGWINLNGQVIDQAALNDFTAFTIRQQTPEGNQLAPGEAANTADDIIAMAREFLVPIGRKDAEDWALRIMEGAASEESLTSWLRGLAKARFANQQDISAAIDSGMTPGQFFASHRQIIADTLEMAPEQIDFMDPKWMSAVELVDESGNRRAPTLSEVGQWARDQNEYTKTSAYRETSASAATGLTRFLGMVS